MSFVILRIKIETVTGHFIRLTFSVTMGQSCSCDVSSRATVAILLLLLPSASLTSHFLYPFVKNSDQSAQHQDNAMVSILTFRFFKLVNKGTTTV